MSMSIISNKNYFITNKDLTSKEDFTAVFIDILHTTLRVKIINDEGNEESSTTTMPITWVSQILPLEKGTLSILSENLEINKSKLIKGYRHIFITNKTLTTNGDFHAVFVDILGNTLLVKLINEERRQTSQISIPLIWISQILTLDDVITSDTKTLDKGSKCITSFLPKELVNLIGYFV